MATAKIVRCDCGHALRMKDVFASKKNNEDLFTFKNFGYMVHKDDIPKRVYIPGRRCPKCMLAYFTVEEV